MQCVANILFIRGARKIRYPEKSIPDPDPGDKKSTGSRIRNTGVAVLILLWLPGATGILKPKFLRFLQFCLFVFRGCIVEVGVYFSFFILQFLNSRFEKLK
jgi:hypothetical protein